MENTPLFGTPTFWLVVFGKKADQGIPSGLQMIAPLDDLGQGIRNGVETLEVSGPSMDARLGAEH